MPRRKPDSPPRNHPGPTSPTDDPANLQAYINAAAKLVIGEPIRAVSRETGIPRVQVALLGTICDAPIEEFREQARLRGQRILALIDEMAPEDIVALKPMERQIAYGIRMDKYRDLTGGTAPTAVHVTNIQVNGANRSEAIALLAGSKRSEVNAQRVVETFPNPTQGSLNPATSPEPIA